MDTSSVSAIAHRSDERFGFASTIKPLALAQLLDTTTPEQLDEHVTWTKEDVEKAGYTPVTKKQLGDGLPLDEVAESAVRVSDNVRKISSSTTSTAPRARIPRSKTRVIRPPK